MKKLRTLILPLLTLCLFGCANASYQIRGTNNDFQQTS